MASFRQSDLLTLVARTFLVEIEAMAVVPAGPVPLPAS